MIPVLLLAHLALAFEELPEVGLAVEVAVLLDAHSAFLGQVLPLVDAPVAVRVPLDPDHLLVLVVEVRYPRAADSGQREETEDYGGSGGGLHLGGGS